MKGKVELTEALGSEIMVHFTIDAVARRDRGRARSPGRHRHRPRARNGRGIRHVRRRDRGPVRPALARQGRRHDRRRRGYALVALLRSRDRPRDLRLIPSKGAHMSRLRISLLVLGAALVSLTALTTTANGASHSEVRRQRQSLVGRRLERRRTEELPAGPERLPEEVPGRQGQVHVGRRQRADGALDRRRRRQPARSGVDQPARARPAVRRRARRSSRSTSRRA